MTNMDLYLALERLMLELDEDENPLADDVRDLMDPIWRRLSAEEIARLDSRGEVDPRALFPVQLPIPAAPKLASATVSNQQFESVGWTAPDNWRRAA